MHHLISPHIIHLTDCIQQNVILSATRLAESSLKTRADPEDPTPGEGWQVTKRFFTSGNLWNSGTLCFSPAWFAQGRHVRSHLYY